MITISRKVAEKMIAGGAVLIQAINNQYYLAFEGVEFLIYDYDYPEESRDTN